jgi:hypothetical protein
MTLFTPRVRLLNVWSRSKMAEHGRIIYETPYKYRIRFSNHTRYLLKHDVGLIDRLSPPRVLSFVSAHAAAPVKDARVVPSEVTPGWVGGKSGSEGVNQELSVSC